MVSTLLAMTVWASLAGAPSEAGVQDGVAAYEDMDLDAAADKLTRALRLSSAKDRPRIELWLGIVELERGNDAAARRWLRSALKASPRLTVKQELSPKVVATIDSIRDAVRVKKPAASEAAAPVEAPAPGPSSSPAVVAASAPAAVPSLASAAAPPTGSLAPLVTPGPSVTMTPSMPFTSSTPAPSASSASSASTASTASTASSASSASTASSAPTSEDSDALAMGDGLEADGLPASPILLASAASGIAAIAAVVGGAAFGALAGIGGEDAQREERAALATKRYEDATTAAAIANGLYVTGGVAVVVAAVCGGIWLADGDAP